jgi:ABC-type uncharacterized transport system permease subunit
MIYSIRVADIPKFIIGFVIAIALLYGLIALWKATGGMPEWVVYSLLAGIVVGSSVAGHFIWKAVCNSWRNNRVRR